MWVALCRVELHFPGARSLKDKRRLLRRASERAHARWRVSIAEVGHQDLHQRAVLGVAAVSGDRGELERLLNGLRRLFDEQVDGYVAGWDEDIQGF
ncbi:MAG: DUF503 domain-containing protein [Thermoanaerobaculia bacterium]